MKIIKFIIPSLLLFMPIGVFAEGCVYDDEAACRAAAASGCYWSYDAALSSNICGQCESGYYSDETECKLCPAGSYCVNGVKKPCPAGKYSDSPGADSCESCGDGEYSNSGADRCTICYPGYYCVDGLYTQCPAGTYNPNKGSTSVEDCTKCPGGKYSYAGCSWCSDCKNMPSNSNGSDPLRAGEYSYLYDKEYEGLTSMNCPWKFSCGKNLTPKCDPQTKTCTCESCGSPYEYSENRMFASSVIYDGEDFVTAPGSERTCPVFQPLRLYSSEEGSASSDQKNFEFYVILYHGQVLLSATESFDPKDFRATATIANVYLSNGLNSAVKFKISNETTSCTFSSNGCGKQGIDTCTVSDLYGDCKWEDIKTIVSDKTEWELDVQWPLDVPVLIAKKKLEFGGEDRDTLHITYSHEDDSCFQWASNPAEVQTYPNGEPKLNDSCSTNETNIKADSDGYNKTTDQVPFLGYTIGCWWKSWNNYSGFYLQSDYIMLENGYVTDFLDFKYPDDCSTQSGLAKNLEDVIQRLEEIGNERIWANAWDYNYYSITNTLSNAENKNKRCFIVGLYGYPPCTPGCYCQDGESEACAPSAPFTSKRGSGKRSDCYLKHDVRFQGKYDFTRQIGSLFQKPGYYYEHIRLLDEK